MDLSLRSCCRDRLQQRLEEITWSAGPDLRAVLTPLLRRPAKRVRPALLFAVAGIDAEPAGTGPVADALTCAAAVELLHQSSLVHDDLMDDAPSRGGVPTLHREHGSEVALVAGDFLVGAAGAALCEVGVDAAAAGHGAYREMCRGQALETLHRHQMIAVERYIEIVGGKSGALLRAACMLGAQNAGFGVEAVAAYGEYGLAFGILFQIVDDLVDLLSTPDLAGKPVGQDLPNGVFTLPVLLAALRYGGSFTAHLGPGGDVGRIQALATRQVVLAEVIAYAVRYADVARQSLHGAAGRSRRRLAALPHAFLEHSVRTRLAPEHRLGLAALLSGAR